MDDEVQAWIIGTHTGYPEQFNNYPDGYVVVQDHDVIRAMSPELFDTFYEWC